MNGYAGRIPHVDLSARAIREQPLAAAILADRPLADIDPLGPENPLIWMTGPLVGTPMPPVGRMSVCALSPLTGIWSESNTGGFLGPELRFSGFDGIVCDGRADRPVWLSIVDGMAELRDAEQLAGLDTYATQDAAWELLGDPAARVSCIGVAADGGTLGTVPDLARLLDGAFDELGWDRPIEKEAGC